VLEASITDLHPVSHIGWIGESLTASQKRVWLCGPFVKWIFCTHIPRFCWFRDYSNFILIKPYLIWVYLVVCLVWSVRELFWKVRLCLAPKRLFAYLSTWWDGKRWFQQMVKQGVGWLSA
jgi:hypothetical protein